MNVYLLLIGGQLLFSISDLLGRHYMMVSGFKLQSFLSVWFVAYLVLKILATTAQLYSFSHFQLGKTMVLFGVVSIVLSNLLGLLFLNEILSTKEYIGVFLAIMAFLVIALGRA